MSFSGFYEYVCESGHYMSNDVYGIDVDKCYHCSKKLVWRHLVDQTNGYGGDKEYAKEHGLEYVEHYQDISAPKTKIDSEYVERIDCLGNKYYIEIPVYSLSEDDKKYWRKLE